MFQSKKDLINRINELEEELDMERHKSRLSAYIESAGLPKCKDFSCLNCDHIVVQRNNLGAVYVLGCGKNVSCPDFSRAANPLTEREKQQLRSEMLSQ